MNDIERILKEEKIYIGKTCGDSMFPMIMAEQDKVVIVPPQFPLKKYDVPVYKRFGHYTMHRIVKVTKKGYVICGDNRTLLEKDITDEDIVGVLAAFYHNGRFIQCTDREYIKYAKKVCRKLPYKVFARKTRRFLRRAKEKLFY